MTVPCNQLLTDHKATKNVTGVNLLTVIYFQSSQAWATCAPGENHRTAPQNTPSACNSVLRMAGE